jgi:YggT family protein
VLNRLINPMVAPIRRFIPNLGGVDISPLVLILLVYFAKDLWNGPTMRGIFF